MKISVLMCSYNRKDLLKRCLESLYRVDFPTTDYEVVLVDDGSTDGMGDMVRSMRAPCKVRYIYTEHVGIAKARNMAINQAEGEVLLFIDDDTFPEPNLLKEHWASHQPDDKLVIMGWVNHIDRLQENYKPKFKAADISTSFFWTSNVSVRREHLIEAGLFDEDFTEYGWEDLELGHRLRNMGLVRKFNPKAIVFHFKKKWKGTDLPRLCKQAESSGRSAVIYLRKRPVLRTRMSTGLFKARFAWNEILKIGKPIFEMAVSHVGERNLSGLSLLSARILVSFHYFKAAQESLAKEFASKPKHNEV
jgi:glycosyltransferase involved in cell wall biosynthesis